jgi:hypothetical protein
MTPLATFEATNRLLWQACAPRYLPLGQALTFPDCAQPFS